MKNNKKMSGGITLIALVVTIIVLLILAGISITMLSGNNGILQRATDAKERTEEAQIDEQAKLDQYAELINSAIEGGSSGGGGSNPTGLSGLTAAEVANLPSGVTEIDYDDITNENLKDATKIKAVITGEVPITTEMTYVTGTKDTGVVVSIDGSEFVWVPVPNVVYNRTNEDASKIPTSTTNSIENGYTYTPMAIEVSGNYCGILYNYSSTEGAYLMYPSATNYQGTSSQYREPAYLTNSSYADASSYNTVGITQSGLQGEYNSMVASVAKYGGFYVGRYELGLEGTNPVSKPASASITTANAENSKTKRWYGVYSKCKSYNVDNLTSTMMWGSQYDAMMNWMIKTGNTVGTADSSKYNTAQTTGSKAEDIINNVYDLYGCHSEWTIEANGTNSRVGRSGCYSVIHSLSLRYNDTPHIVGSSYGSRLSLYVK